MRSFNSNASRQRGGKNRTGGPPPQPGMPAIRQAILDRLARPPPLRCPHCEQPLNHTVEPKVPKSCQKAVRVVVSTARPCSVRAQFTRSPKRSSIARFSFKVGRAFTPLVRSGPKCFDAKSLSNAFSNRRGGTLKSRPSRAARLTAFTAAQSLGSPGLSENWRM
jgi:hypothetical protein